MHPPWFYHSGNHYRIDYDLKHGNVSYVPPSFETGLVHWLSQYANVFTAYPTQEFFNSEFQRERSNFVDYFATDNLDISRLGCVCEMCDIALNETWHSPSFILKVNEHYYFNTGQQKLVATGVSCKPMSEYRCVIIDYDQRKLLPPTHWQNVQKIENDQQLQTYIGSEDYVLDFNFLKYEKNVLPGVVNFSRHYPAQYQPDRTHLGNQNMQFVQQRLKHDNFKIYVSDAFDSNIYDSSGYFDIQSHESFSIGRSWDIRRKLHVRGVLGQWYFHTLKQIDFDLANLLPYLRKDINLYVANDNSYYHWVESEDYQGERWSCPSSHK